MGADLYIDGIFDANKDKYEALFHAACKKRDALPRDSKEHDEAHKEVTELYDKMYGVGYFRDSYNGSSLFWHMGLSWWAMISDGKNKKPTQFISSRGFISIANAKRLRVVVEALPITMKPDDYDGWEAGTTKDQVDKYFTDKKQAFLDFLDLAIKNKKKIRASV